MNLHLKDGAVIVNVLLTSIRKNDFGKGRIIEYVPYKDCKTSHVPLRHVAWAELLNLRLMETAG